MDIRNLVRSIDAATARAFVTAARSVIDALMIEGQRVRQTQAPPPRDYAGAALSRETPPGGWISDDELRSASQRMNEAIAAEKWSDGVLFALRALSALGAI
jgi:hypothetical protein